MDNDARKLAAKLKEDVKEFVEEEKKTSGGGQAFVAGGVGGVFCVLVGESQESRFWARAREAEGGMRTGRGEMSEGEGGGEGRARGR